MSENRACQRPSRSSVVSDLPLLSLQCVRVCDLREGVVRSVYIYVDQIPWFGLVVIPSFFQLLFTRISIRSVKRVLVSRFGYLTCNSNQESL